MEEIRHYKKYAGKSAEEILKIKREQMREITKRRKEKMSEEEREEERKKKNEYNKSYNYGGVCEICGKEYKNIYQHRNTKKHKEKAEKN